MHVKRIIAIPNTETAVNLVEMFFFFKILFHLLIALDNTKDIDVVTPMHNLI